MKIWLLLILLFNGFLHVRGQYSPGLLALEEVNLLEVQRGSLVSNYTVLIRGKIIEAVGPTGSVPIPDSAQRINCRGSYLIPGLIDAHVHLLSDVSGEDYRARAESDAKAMLLSGITSVRDMAGDGRSLASFARDALVGDIDAPDVYYVTLFAGPSFFTDPRTHKASRGGLPGQMLYMRGVTDSSNIPLTIAEARGTGATAIKLYAQLTAGLAQKLTAEAHVQGLRVWSHFDLTKASPIETIEAGVDVVSHVGMLNRWRPDRKDSIPVSWRASNLDSAFWNREFRAMPMMDYIRVMKKNKTILDATLLLEAERRGDPSLSPYNRAVYISRYELGRRFVKLALDNGIPVCTGTDVDENKFVQREIKTLVTDAGFTPAQAILAATLNGARAIGIENRTGSIEKGKEADLVLLAANPLLDINYIDQVKLVIKKGKLYNPR